ncbi:MAG: hypothetical protein A2Y73_06895 [Chloroflexi bacterium RBG_13_56_8]|nr:MAG: hypothetical protein A2Y73_06895 [Chloroflexi bacterium RBG_13_56_8]
MTIPANLDTYIQVLLFVLGAYLFALYLGLIVWTFRDIHARSRDVLAQIMATLLVAVFTIPGLLLYWLLRPHTTLAEEYERDLAEEALLQDLEEQRTCPSCHRRIAPDFVVCPHCHHQLRLRCVGCERLLDPHWDVCPYCGLLRDQEGMEEEEDAAVQVQKPLPLWESTEEPPTLMEHFQDVEDEEEDDQSDEAR